MIYDCPTCTAALRFNPTLNKLECLSCGNKYDLSEFENKETADVINTVTTEKNGETMECNIYSCTACGAELAVNGVESSTFCAYCGQPTIVFNRVSSALKPRYIIPFSIPKEQAVNSIREHLAKGEFVPDEIKNFEVERVRGIYIPYFLYDIDYEDQQYLKGNVRVGNETVTRYFYRNASCHFHNISLDASNQLSDESSQRLEPFQTSAIVPFEIAYLSGFYADCFDVKHQKIKQQAIERTKELFDREMERTVNASSVKAIQTNPKCYVKNSSYAMFPAWFMTFRYKDEPYTILVNGQTGKVVGAVPFETSKVKSYYAKSAVGCSILSTILMMFLLFTQDDPMNILFFALIVAIVLFIAGASKFAKVKKSISLSQSTTMNDFVKNRQEGN